jgi:N,N'-diacetyllegionaminate synthase
MSGDKVFIIAEAGVNHNGDMRLARELVHAAADAKVDAVKFQTFRAESLVRRDAAKAQYQVERTGNSEGQYEMLKRLELSWESHHELKALAEKRGIEFMSTPFDTECADFLAKLGVKRFKIPSGEITNYPYLRHVARLKIPVIFSTGMSDMTDIESCLNTFLANGLSREQVSVLHCNTEYPTPPEDVNLRAMLAMKERFQLTVGYSDHTAGTEVSVAAVAMGARIIEKHFTMDKNLPGPDHLASLEPAELVFMAQSIRNISLALGNSLKGLSRSEAKNRHAARKSIVAAKQIKKGELFTEDNLTTKRPGSGISPMRWTEIIGKTAPRDFTSDEMIDQI